LLKRFCSLHVPEPNIIRDIIEHFSQVQNDGTNAITDCKLSQLKKRPEEGVKTFCQDLKRIEKAWLDAKLGSGAKKQKRQEFLELYGQIDARFSGLHLVSPEGILTERRMQLVVAIAQIIDGDDLQFLELV
jgi:hypothetical protein